MNSENDEILVEQKHDDDTVMIKIHVDDFNDLIKCVKKMQK